MKARRMKLAASLSAAMAVGLGLEPSAHATVDNSPNVYLVVAAPGVTIGSAGFVTALCTAVAWDDPEPTAYQATSYVFGGLNLVSAGIYSTLSFAVDDERAPSYWLPVAAANLAIGGANIGLAAATGAGDEHRTESNVRVAPVVVATHEGGYGGVAGAF